MPCSSSRSFKCYLNCPHPCSIRAYVSNVSDNNNFGQETLMSMVMHYANTVLSGRLPNLKVFHYSDMVRDGRRTVEALAAAAGIEASARVIDKVTKATAFGAMKAKAADYAPVGGTGFWKNDANFFDSAELVTIDGRCTMVYLHFDRIWRIACERLQQPRFLFERSEQFHDEQCHARYHLHQS